MRVWWWSSLLLALAQPMFLVLWLLTVLVLGGHPVTWVVFWSGVVAVTVSQVVLFVHARHERAGDPDASPATWLILGPFWPLRYWWDHIRPAGRAGNINRDPDASAPASTVERS